jgi:DNA polymerase-3 subunit chi
MTRVDFYFNAADKLELARKLAGKAYQSGLRALLYTADERLANDLDSAIWTRDKLSFVPHVRCGHPRAKETPVLIGTDPGALASPDMLINLDAECPSCFSRFERLLEVVGTDPADIQAGRLRYRFYKDRGYEIKNNDMTGK